MVDDPRIDKALFFLEENLKNDVQLADLAGAAGMSKHHFHRLFVKETGETPAQSVSRQKIYRAAHDLLILSDARVIDIAFEYGFSSPAVFTRTFRKILGKSPTHFRRDRLAELGWDQRKKLAKAQKQVTGRKVIPLRHFNRRLIKVVRCSLAPEELNAAYQQLLAGKPDDVTHAIGIYVEPPTGRLAERLHYIGLDQPVEEGGPDNTFDIPGGYYSYFAVNGDFASQQQKAIANHETVIGPSPYKVASTTFFERVPLDNSSDHFDHFAMERMIYVLVRRK